MKKFPNVKKKSRSSKKKTPMAYPMSAVISPGLIQPSTLSKSSLFFSTPPTGTVYLTFRQEKVLSRSFKVLDMPSVASCTRRICSFSSSREATRVKKKPKRSKETHGTLQRIPKTTNHKSKTQNRKQITNTKQETNHISRFTKTTNESHRKISDLPSFGAFPGL